MSGHLYTCRWPVLIVALPVRAPVVSWGEEGSCVFPGVCKEMMGLLVSELLQGRGRMREDAPAPTVFCDFFSFVLADCVHIYLPVSVQLLP